MQRNFAGRASTVSSWFPRRLATRIATVRKDLSFLLNGLQGRRGPVVQDRASRRDTLAYRAEYRAQQYEVQRIVRETPEAISVMLQPVHGEIPSFLAGQFLSLVVPTEEGECRRAYSLANPAREGEPLRITVKRVPDGIGSGWVHDQLEVGARIHALGPSGSFHWSASETAPQTLVMFAGGSGITPIMSILQTALYLTPDVKIHLMYANRRHASIIFRERLEELEGEFPKRLKVQHILEEETQGFDAEPGRISPEFLQRWLQEPERRSDSAGYYLCGPTPMMDIVRGTLQEAGISPERVFSESYASPKVQTRPALTQNTETCVVDTPSGEQRVMVAPGQTLLEASLDAGVQVPFSCTLGGCGACRVKVASGDVVMQTPNCLTQSERDEGYVLTCVGYPAGPVRLRVVEADHG